jgi:hypothetical protein
MSLSEALTLAMLAKAIAIQTAIVEKIVFVGLVMRIIFSKK